MKIALINVGIGNIESVERALHFLGAPFENAHDEAALATATHIILPGVGAFGAGMAALRAHDLVEPLRRIARDRRSRVLGICLGMQLLGEFSEEGQCEGLGLLPFRVEGLAAVPEKGIKVPHVGFSAVEGFEPAGLFSGLSTHADFYFTHSYALLNHQFEANFGFCQHGERFIAAFESGAICGAQFHPEKSQSNGLKLLRNFLSVT